MGYVVTAPMVVVSVPLGVRASQVRFLEQGAALPDGVAEDSLKHLLSLDMIAEVQEAEPLGSMTVDELKAHAAENGIDLGDARTKADIMAAIQATRVE